MNEKKEVFQYTTKPEEFEEYIKEMSRRAAAGLAKTTQGKANVIESKKVYDRKENQKEMKSYETEREPGDTK